MAYGELIVYLADGTVHTFPIEKSTTAIGRSPGNDVVLPTSSASRYHAHVIVGEEGVSFVDLGTVNGTFVNDQLLPPNASVALDGTEEIRIGDARLFFRPAEGTVPQKSEASLVQTRMGLSAVSGLLAELEEPQQTVPPGGRMQMRLIIQNPSDAVRLCEVELAGMESKWASTNRREVRLEAQESTEVLISVHPPRAYDTKPGRYELAVKVTPHDDPDKTIHQTRFIDVVDFHGLGMVVRLGQQPGAFRVYIQNQGNVPAEVQLGGWHPQRALKYKFDKPRLKLAPGETQEVSLQVRPGQMGQSPGRTGFAVVARSLDASGYQAAVPVTYPRSEGGGNGGNSFLTGNLLLVMLGVVSGGLVVLGTLGFIFFRSGVRLPAGQPPGPDPPAESATAEPPSGNPAAIRFPAPSSVVAFFDPPEAVRYQDVPIVLRYTVEADASLSPEELAFQLVDQDTQTVLKQFTVVSFEGMVALEALMGPEWQSSVYRANRPLNYVLLVSARNSTQTTSSPARLVLHSVECHVANGASARAGPGAAYLPVEPRLSASEVYWPVAQANINDALWYQIESASAGTVGWLETDDLTCSMDGQPWGPPPGFRFFELTAAPPTPVP